MLALDIIMALMMAATLLYGAYFLAVALLARSDPKSAVPTSPRKSALPP